MIGDLVDNGIPINAFNKKGQTPLHIAITSGQSAALATLIEKGAHVNCPVSVGDGAQFKLNALGVAVMRGEIDCVDQLLKSKKCNLSFHYVGLGNLLHVAIYFHQFPLLQHLLEHYKIQFENQIEQRNEEDLTPLSFAASLGEHEAVGILFHNQASIEVRDFNERLPIHHAAAACHYDTIQLLASLGSSIDAPDINHKRPYDLAYIQLGEQAQLCANLLVQLSRSKQLRKASPTPSLSLPHHLVFRGGGTKGLAYAGALAVLEEEKLMRSTNSIAGTSAGAITAGLLAINYPIRELEPLLRNMNLMDFLDHPLSKQKLTTALKESTKSVPNAIKTLFQTFKACVSLVGDPSKLITGPLKALYHCVGICEGEEFRKWIEGIISTQTGIEYLTFGELAQLIKEGRPYKHIYVYGTRVGSQLEITQFNSTDPKWKDVIVSDAIRISMSIPGVFKPHSIHIKTLGKRVAVPAYGSYLDGGMLYNFPIETFDRKKFLTREDLGSEGECPKYNKHTLGFSLFSSLTEVVPDASNVDTVFDLLKSICGIYFNAEEAIRRLTPYNAGRIIDIDVKEIGTLSFKMIKCSAS